MSSFTMQEQERMDAIARRIADILWDEYPGTKGRYVWENAYHSALELVLQINHPNYKPVPRMMVVPDGGKPHEESPDCRAAGCVPVANSTGVPLTPSVIEAFMAPIHESLGRDSTGVESPKNEQVANLLTNLAQILDVVKGEWGEAWSAWDQEQRDGITKFLTGYYRPKCDRCPNPVRLPNELCDECKDIGRAGVESPKCTVCGSNDRLVRRRAHCEMMCPPQWWRWIKDSRLSLTDEIECDYHWHEVRAGVESEDK